MLETCGVAIDAALVSGWREHVVQMNRQLDWPEPTLVARVHARDASLAFSAPLDQLLSATEVNEWAWLAALLAGGHAPLLLFAPGHPAAWDVDLALHTLQAHARAERSPALLALVAAAEARRLSVLIDEDTLSIGMGDGCRSFAREALPDPATLDWNRMHDVPVALVTGSNGKTTTTRLLAAFTRAHGWHTAYTCTDGVLVDTRELAAGDYSGPAGARVALRAPAIDAAILETARGGLLRRGLAVTHARCAIITNISDDHFGEYGVHDLDDLAFAKFAVARALDAHGVLILNADDTLLVRHAADVSVPLAWFALDANAPLLVDHRARGGITCGVRDGHLMLEQDAASEDLGAITAMPLSLDGSAHYNVANIAAAVIAAHVLGVKATQMRAVLARFGADPRDNPGRLQSFDLGGVHVLVDYAHNPDGLRGLLQLARPAAGERLALLLGQAGNREDGEIRELAGVAAEFAPDRIVLKDMSGMLRGRTVGEVPALLREELLRRGLRDEMLVTCLDEYTAVRTLLAWARPGDLLVLPIHGKLERPKVGALLTAMQAQGWTPGAPLPVPG